MFLDDLEEKEQHTDDIRREVLVPSDDVTQVTVIDAVDAGINIQIFVSWEDLQDLFSHIPAPAVSPDWEGGFLAPACNSSQE